MNKNLLFAVFLAVVLGIAFIVITSNKKDPTYVPGRWREADVAVQQAKHFYNLKKQAGDDLSSGPCISNGLIPGWVADIAHNPRQPIDDLPENQCPAFREGPAQHFVELDPDGNLIRVQ